MTDRNSRAEKKKIPAGWIRLLLYLLQHLSAAAAAFCAVIILVHTSVRTEDMGTMRRYNLDPFDGEEAFSDSYLFLNIFTNHVSNVIENVVIERQLGKDGSLDPGKAVDISQYANRKDLNYDNSQPTAYYWLEDLLKWYRDGITYSGQQFFGMDGLASYLPFYANTEVISVESYDIEYEEDNVGIVQYVVTDDGTILFGNNFLDMLKEHNIYYQINTEENRKVFTARIMLPDDRYMTVDGKTLKECAGSWEEYCVLINNLERSVYDLGYNYDIYMRMQEGISRQNTNLRYHVQIEKNNNISEFTNDIGRHIELESYYRQMEKYVIYDPYNLFFETNIPGFEEEMLRVAMAGFEYTFGDNSRVYIGVDPRNGADDIYAEAMSAYTVMQHIWIYGGIILGSLLVWVALLVFLSVTTGRKRSQDGSILLKPAWFDYVPTEMLLALAAAMIVFTGRKESLHWIWEVGRAHIVNIAVGLALLLSVLFTTCWYSLIRRLKMHILWRHSILGFLCGKIWQAASAGWRRVEELADGKKSDLGRAAVTLIPFGILLIGNIGTSFWGLYYTLSGNGFEFVMGLVILGVLLLVDLVFAYQMVKNTLNRKKIVKGILMIRDGDTDYQVDIRELHGENLELANAVNSIGTGIRKAVETSMKDERLKADLITNVSHDIKTPLTSIINYVDLLKREKIETQPVKGYIEVLDAKSQRLKQLTDDLVEASKISSGNIVLNIERIDLVELLKQSVGEFSEKFEQKNLTVLENYGKHPHMINADSRRMWRVVENLFSNICKYALEGTRIYIDIMRNRFEGNGQILLSIKNISAQPLNISPEELTERFIRGDESRTTEGSGLGLSIAKSLVEAQGGTLNIILDGDLFKVIILFDEAHEAPLALAEGRGAAEERKE
ncbi:MAG: HAMP domain-containing histidine kinase [Lachnospiraceae bacterium]|nr:HAMP domain-containing histidine kinase [Lachnospiraceae bacterium]